MVERVMDDHRRRLECAETARRWLKQKPVYLDVETTGLGDDDEVIEVGLVDHTNEVLMETLVRPRKPISEGAREVHGIRDEAVAEAPSWDQIHERFVQLVRDRLVVIYNQEFDAGMVDTSATKHDLSVDCLAPTACAMRLYSKWCGDWNEHEGGYRYQKLQRAMGEFEIGGRQSHRAVDDARTARRVVQSIANYEGKFGFLDDILSLLRGEG